ncbi:CPBP family intramembrane metalloprotease [Psychromonas sp. 14N.309.X.WAT.B.A12]|uniref:CPBP family intramembrane glutamic endopeptidase n=1 Tax=Psychromonas sp. 14N.309.X.WAT.B.A12 TaxID=2998322 RepID=UPI0025B07CF3|nr:CPBP family intramembrane glutamic endopeptidase [Psychromonas sp. 14N.309.X.WAT.B.A12]MDN2663767.1 CPBP family intramembrane metalloprotease [Psychromonas sp. 14N.309.X.WAT.B.A12]
MMTFYILALAILAVFPYCKMTLFKQPLWYFLLLISVCFAFTEQYINLIGVSSLLLYFALYYAALNIKLPFLSKLFTSVFIVTGVALALHFLPGFNNLPIIINEQISKDAITYTLYANVDKGIAGLLLTAYFFKKLNKSDTSQSYINTLCINWQSAKQPILVIISTIVVTLTLALLLELVDFNPKVPDFWFEFIAINLLFTCVAEEALFRGILQTKLSQRLSHTRLSIFSPMLVACVFAAAHFMGGLNYVLVSAVAGFGYGYIFYKTQCLEWAILCHWLLNLCHFFLFTYPMLK